MGYQVRKSIEKILVISFISDETFTFHLLGEDKRLHTSANSYPSHIQQFRTTCSLM
jgi:hypothetical protein